MHKFFDKGFIIGLIVAALLQANAFISYLGLLDAPGLKAFGAVADVTVVYPVGFVALAPFFVCGSLSSSCADVLMIGTGIGLIAHALIGALIGKSLYLFSRRSKPTV